MKFSMRSKNDFSFASAFLTLVLGFVVCVITVTAQKPEKPEFAASASLEQCRNGAATSPVGCVAPGGATGWVSGNAGSSNSHWAETQFIAYRMLMSGLPGDGTTVHSLTIGYDILKSGRHAIDYLGTYNYTESGANPCAGVAGCTFGSPSDTAAIPTDGVTVTNNTNPNTGNPVAQIPGQFTIWGGQFTNCLVPAPSVEVYYQPYGGGEERQITVCFTATVANPVVAWGGHIAWVGDWGLGNSAGGISGSPYHMSLIDLDGGGGHQDRSLSADSVIPSGAVFIRKVVNTLDCRGEAILAWPFTATANFGPTSFSLIDNVVNPTPSCLDGPTPSSPQASQAITSFGAGNTITVSESPAPPPPAGWTFANVNCVESGLADSTQNSLTPTASIIVQLGEVVTCTFTNTQFAPSAALVSVSGRVFTFYGMPVTRARVIITDQSGVARMATTNNFGYYRFDDVEVGQTYVVNVVSKQYQFSPRVMSLDDAIADFDFFAF